MRDPQDADVLDADVLDTETGSRWTSRLPIAVAVAAVVVAIDQITKWWALQALDGGSCANPDACIELFAGARFRLVYNNGAAFSSGGDYGPIFGVLAFFMSFLLLYLASNQPRLRGLVPFAAIAGGAVGNLLDRAFRASDGFLSGAVIDFVDLGWWPVFNFADSAIVVGVAFVILFTALNPEAGEQQPAEPDDSDTPSSANIDPTHKDEDPEPASPEASNSDQANAGTENPQARVAGSVAASFGASQNLVSERSERHERQ